jgi:hypothetical protein
MCFIIFRLKCRVSLLSVERPFRPNELATWEIAKPRCRPGNRWIQVRTLVR